MPRDDERINASTRGTDTIKRSAAKKRNDTRNSLSRENIYDATREVDYFKRDNNNYCHSFLNFKTARKIVYAASVNAHNRVDVVVDVVVVVVVSTLNFHACRDASHQLWAAL